MGRSSMVAGYRSQGKTENDSLLPTSHFARDSRPEGPLIASRPAVSLSRPALGASDRVPSLLILAFSALTPQRVYKPSYLVYETKAK